MSEAARAAVERLLELVPPPRRRVTRGDWSQVAWRLRTPLPEDFVQLATAWGEGSLVDHVFISAADRFVERAEEMLGWEREARAAIGEPGRPLWPERGGLLPWADTGNGDQLWWSTNGPSDAWTVSSQEARSDEIVETGLTAAEALLAFLEGRLEVFGEFDIDLQPWFRSTRDSALFEWRDPVAALEAEEADVVAAVGEVLPVASPRGGWKNGADFQRHWVTGDDDWNITVERHGELVGLRLTCPQGQEEAARQAAADVARRLGVIWGEPYVSRWTG
jgi:hypothetical protein